MKHLAFFFLFLFIIPSGFSQSDCDLKTDKEGIKVYTCEIKDSKFKAVKSSFELKSSLSEFAAAVLDIEGHKDWEYKTISSEVLKKISEKELIYYTEVAAPVMTNNRDFIIQLTVNQNPSDKQLTIDLISLPDYIPAKDGIVRVPFSKARYTVKPISPSQLLVEYYIEIDLGGSVPPWMVNMVADKAPYETFTDLRKIIGKYKGKGVGFIRD